MSADPPLLARAARRELPFSITYRGKKRPVKAELVQQIVDGEAVAFLVFRLAGCPVIDRLELKSLVWSAIERRERGRRVDRAQKKKDSAA